MTSRLHRDALSVGGSTAMVGGAYQIEFPPEKVAGASSPLPAQVNYTLPSGTQRLTRGFLTASGAAQARCYVAEEGLWKWEAKNQDGRGIGVGHFQALASPLPGKLRISREDPSQLELANGERFLHFGDTAHRFLDPGEERWQAYLDQAVQAGFNKIRVSLPALPSDASSLFAAGRKGLDLARWDEADRRLRYALARYPQVQFQVSPFGEDAGEAQRHSDGDAAANLAMRYALERFSGLPNVHWSVINELDLEASADPAQLRQAVSQLGKHMSQQDHWGSLLTCQQSRFSDFAFHHEPWCSVVSISDLGQVDGRRCLEERRRSSKPVVLEADRNERDLKPLLPRYFFRRLYWATLLSGAYPTYCGLDTSRPYDGHLRGIQGYYDACNGGRLRGGAHDLLKIRQFFRESGLDLAHWTPDDAMAGGNPLLVKAMRSPSGGDCIAYIANPDAHKDHAPRGYEGHYSDQNAGPSETFTTFTLELPFSSGTAKWFSPSEGEWRGKIEVTRNSTTLLTPAPGDWVIWARRS